MFEESTDCDPLQLRLINSMAKTDKTSELAKIEANLDTRKEKKEQRRNLKLVMKQRTKQG
jgi:hypothetical protein